MLVNRTLDELINRLMLRVEDAGGEGGEGGSGSGSGEGGEGGEETKPKTLTQDEVNRIVSREKAAAERTAKKQFDEWLAGQKSEQDKTTMDEAQRAKADADEAKAEGERLKLEGKQERLAAKIERKLSAAGVDEKALERASRLVALDVDATDDDIAAEIETLKTDMPGLFGTVDDNGEHKPPSGVTKTKPPAGGQGAKTALERGAEAYRSKKKSATAA